MLSKINKSNSKLCSRYIDTRAPSQCDEFDIATNTYHISASLTSIKIRKHRPQPIHDVVV